MEEKWKIRGHVRINENARCDRCDGQGKGAGAGNGEGEGEGEGKGKGEGERWRALQFHAFRVKK